MFDLDDVRYAFDDKAVLGLCDPWVQDAIVRARANAAQHIIEGGNSVAPLEEFLPAYAVKTVAAAIKAFYYKEDKLAKQAENAVRPKYYKAARKQHGRVNKKDDILPSKISI